MDLFLAKEAAVAGKIFGYLEWNDLLRLRRSSKDLKKITNAYLKANPWRAPEIEVNEEKDKSFGAFLTLGLATTKLFLNNSSSGHHFYEGGDEEEANIRQFLEDHGSLITDLRVTQLTLANGAVCQDKELSFMESLPNLKTFEASYCVSGKSAADLKKKTKEPPLDEMGNLLLLPKTFKLLESVKIGLDQDPNLRQMERKKRTRDFLTACPKLKSISMPVSWHSPNCKIEGSQLDTTGTIEGDLFFYLMSIVDRPNIVFEEKADVPLEWIDFENCHEGYGAWLQEKFECARALPRNWHSSRAFLNICMIAEESGLKLKNVSPLWYYSRYPLGKENLKTFGYPVYSLVGLDPIIMEVPMPNLEKIIIPSTKLGCVGGGKVRPDWPKLKSLDITVDGNEGLCWDFEGAMSAQEGANNGIRGQDTNELFGYLFMFGKREGMEELKIKFVKGMKNGGNGSRIPEVEQNGKEKILKGVGAGTLRWGMREELSVPSLEMIVKCCPNLKRVMLGNWQGSNQDLLGLWDGLGEGLEEVELKGCENVGDFTFFGEDKGKPVFLKLNNLKKLSLKGLDKMGKVSDLLFTEVLAKMKLKQLLITSEKPIDKVTKSGIEALLEGPFAETICKFPFRGWSLAEVTQEEFEQLGKKFRSYNML